MTCADDIVLPAMKTNFAMRFSASGRNIVSKIETGFF